MTYIKNSSLSTNLKSHIVCFISTVIGYSLFSTLEGDKWLHDLILRYIKFFLDNVNYLELGYALSISLVIITYFLLTQLIYVLFNMTSHKIKSETGRNIVEYILNITTAVWISWFAIAVFSPYLEFTRDTYNFYNIMLWVKVLIIVLITLITLIWVHALFNTVWIKLNIFSKKWKQAESFSEYDNPTEENQEYSNQLLPGYS